MRKFFGNLILKDGPQSHSMGHKLVVHFLWTEHGNINTSFQDYFVKDIMIPMLRDLSTHSEESYHIIKDVKS